MAGAIAEIRTHKDVRDLAARYEGLKNRLAGVKEKATVAAGRAIHSAETVGTAFGFGYARGRFSDANGEWEMAGVPPDLTAGVLLLGASFVGLTGKYDDHVAAIGTGAAAAYGTVKGIEMGAASAKAVSHDPMGPARPVTAGTRRPAVGEGSAAPWAAGRARQEQQAGA